jgi:acetylglutamate kinase
LKIVVKIGGAALEDEAILRTCARTVSELARNGHRVALLHGGGKALTRLLQALEKSSEFVNGLRVTDAETRDAALMVLSGILNKKLVAAIAQSGFDALGLCGGDGSIFVARKKSTSGGDLGFVGEITHVNPQWLEAIWERGGIPVLSSIALGEDGEYYNVNADEAASACAVACHASLLAFLTDVSGVKDATGEVMPVFEIGNIDELVSKAVIAGGMLPKLKACRDALAGGVRQVRILPAKEAEALLNPAFEEIHLGTEVVCA